VAPVDVPAIGAGEDCTGWELPDRDISFRHLFEQLIVENGIKFKQGMHYR